MAKHTEPTSPVPYVGISGITSKSHQEALLSYADALGLLSQRHLLFGAKATHKTQFLDVANKYGTEWYPVGAAGLSSVLRRAHGIARSINAAQLYLEPSCLNDWNYRDRFVQKVVARSLPWLGALQFDMLPWHTDGRLLSWLAELKRHLGFTIILQCHDPAMTALGPQGIADIMSEHPDAADYLLFDASHGRGQPLDAERLSRYLNAMLERKVPSLGLGVAGGLDPQTVRQDLPSLLALCPGLSWDAESSLRSTTESGAKILDIGKARRYLEACSTVLA